MKKMLDHRAVIEQPGQMAYWRFEGTQSVRQDWLMQERFAIMSEPDPEAAGKTRQFMLDHADLRYFRQLGKAEGYTLPHVQLALMHATPVVVQPRRLIDLCALTIVYAALVTGAPQREIRPYFEKVTDTVRAVPAQLDALARSIVPHP